MVWPSRGLGTASNRARNTGDTGDAMRFFGFRITTWLMFGIGFLLGSRAGKEPWQRAMEMWNDFRGEGAGSEAHTGNGHRREPARKAGSDVMNTVSGSRG